MELPKMPNESKTRNQSQKKSQITKTVLLQLKIRWIYKFQYSI